MLLNHKSWDRVLGQTLLGLLLAILVFGPVALGAVHAAQFLVVQGLLVAVLLVWGARLWLSPRAQLFWPPICWVALAFMVYAVIRYLTADIEYVARQEMIQVLVLGFFFLAVLNHLFRQEAVQAATFVLVALATVISFLAIYQYLHHVRFIWGHYSPYPGRAFGTYVSPNNFSCFLELLMPPALAFLVAGRLPAAGRVLLGYALLMMGAGLVVTLSRGGWAATGAGVVTTLVLLATHRRHRLLAGLLLILLLGGTGYVAHRHFDHAAAVNDQSVSSSISAASRKDLDMRLDMWQAAVNLWRDNFWFGAGPAHYDWRFRAYRPERMQLQPDRAHNDYLNLLADWGTAGGLLVLAGLAAFVVGLAKTWPHIQRAEADFNPGYSNRFAFFTGACGALLSLSLHSAMDFNLHIPANAALGLAWLALLTSQQRFATERWWVTPGPALKGCLTAALLAGVVYLSLQGWRRTRETLWLHRADAQVPVSSAQAACLIEAVAADPQNFKTIYDLAEVWRVNSFAETDNYKELAARALQGYQRSQALNPYYIYNPLRSGMCLDWLERHAEATVQFRQAELLDPNGAYTMACIGWHYALMHDYAAARQRFIRSCRLDSEANETASRYLFLIDDRLKEDSPPAGEF